MAAPVVISKALWATILSFVLPRILSEVLHSELLAATRIMTNKQRATRTCRRTLEAAILSAIQDLARSCLKYFPADAIRTNHKEPFSSADPIAGCRAELLRFSPRAKRRTA